MSSRVYAPIAVERDMNRHRCMFMSDNKYGCYVLEAGMRHKLAFINILAEDGTINEKGGEFAGQHRFKARDSLASRGASGRCAAVFGHCKRRGPAAPDTRVHTRTPLRHTCAHMYAHVSACAGMYTRMHAHLPIQVDTTASACPEHTIVCGV